VRSPRLLLLRIRAHAWLARKVPSYRLATAIDDMAMGLVELGRFVKPMHRKHALEGPWIGDLTCGDINCRAKSRVLSLEPLDPRKDYVCGECGQETAWL